MRYTPKNYTPEELLMKVGFVKANGMGLEIKRMDVPLVRKPSEKNERLHAFVHHGRVDLHWDKDTGGEHEMERSHYLVKLYMRMMIKLDRATDSWWVKIKRKLYE